jgi:hypothetical protein
MLNSNLHSTTRTAKVNIFRKSCVNSIRNRFISKNQRKANCNRTRHEFLLTFFDLPHRYGYKEINGFILVRQFNSGNNQWEVAIYTKESWKKVKEWKQEQKLNQAELL